MRTTVEQVKLILRAGTENSDYDDLGEPDLTPYLEAAGAIVDDVYACSVKRLKTLDATRLELLERWLAAHAYKMSDQPYQQSRTQSSAAIFQGVTGMGLEGTKYGQMALTLDPTGCLSLVASGANRKVATVAWLGKLPSEQTPVQRSVD